jgi:uncharacterized membrane protein
MNSSINKASSGAGWLAIGLGWFSVFLGLLGIFAPRRTARTMGIRSRPLIFRLIGLRELASGLGILTDRQRAKSGWLWSRVGGDAVDLALIGMAFPKRGTHRDRLGIATGAVAGVTILDTIGALLHTPANPVHVVKTITVNRDPKDLYAAWRELTNLPHFMVNLQSVTPIDKRHSHWVAKAPSGMQVEWDAEITEDIPNAKIAWRASADADVQHTGSVQFTPAAGGRGTVVQVTLDYTPPAGKIGAMGAKLATIFGRAPEQQVDSDLHRFAQWMETGFVTTTEGQPTGAAGRRAGVFDLAASR